MASAGFAIRFMPLGFLALKDLSVRQTSVWFGGLTFDIHYILKLFVFVVRYCDIFIFRNRSLHVIKWTSRYIILSLLMHHIWNVYLIGRHHHYCSSLSDIDGLSRFCYPIYAPWFSCSKRLVMYLAFQSFDNGHTVCCRGLFWDCNVVKHVPTFTWWHY
jgi:hypothetical protein